MSDGQGSMNKEDIGAHTFHLRQAAAIERTLGRIRHTLGKDWQKLQDEEIQSLTWTLEKAWSRMGFYDWDVINIAAIDMSATDELISIGRRGRAGRLSEPNVASQAVRVLTELGTRS